MEIGLFFHIPDLSEKLIIEVDDVQHAQTVVYDHQRTRFLEQKGFKVIRFWNNEVFFEPQLVIDVIHAALLNPPPPSSPSRGEDIL